MPLLQLPSSCIPPYSQDYWLAVRSKLEALISNPSLKNLLETIESISKLRQCPKAERIANLSRLNKTIAAFNQDEHSQRILIRNICNCALHIESLFPSGSIEMLSAKTANTISFPAFHVHCILSHMFLGTFRCCPEGNALDKKHENGPFSFASRMSFLAWFSDTSFPTTDIYIRALLHVFSDGLDDEKDNQSRQVTFERKVLNLMPDLEHCNNRLVPVNVFIQGRIGDIEEIEVDFANACVGGGPGGTQEELLLGMNPESLVIALLNDDPLLDNESIMISGVKKFADYEGYGLDAKYVCWSMESWIWSERKIVAIDAMMWFQDESGVTRVKQMKKDALSREVLKCCSGFSAGEGQGISTGHWGCGAFGGDKEVKAVVQLMAASIVQVKHLNYFTFGDSIFANDFTSMLQQLGQHEVTVKELWHIMLLECKSMKDPVTFKEKYDPEPFLFKKILSHLSG
eukprot:gene20261-22246_t